MRSMRYASRPPHSTPSAPPPPPPPVSCRDSNHGCWVSLPLNPTTGVRIPVRQPALLHRTSSRGYVATCASSARHPLKKSAHQQPTATARRACGGWPTGSRSSTLIWSRSSTLLWSS
eukprot:4763481-Prymnesium_polylepis.1